MKHLVLLLLVSCQGFFEKDQDVTPELTCTRLGTSEFSRCENEEVTCYTFYRSLSCKFKELGSEDVEENAEPNMSLPSNSPSNTSEDVEYIAT